MSTEQPPRRVPPLGDRSVLFGMPRRIIGLLWLPIVLALLFLGQGQQVAPVWLYPVGLVPAVVGWLVFALPACRTPCRTAPGPV